MMQRFFDVFFSAFGLLFLLPLALPLFIILRFTGEGEVFYRQVRVGKGGLNFDLLKFATMLKNSPSIGTGNITLKNDPRVLPLGNFLRRTKINELPQLLNIFRGDMSVIGPRPLTRDHFEAYTPVVQRAIAEVRPGLSGVGSVVFRAEEEMLHERANAQQFYKENIAPYKGDLEKWYVSNQNLVSYFFLIFATLWVVFFPRSRLIWHIFSSLPRPPAALSRYFF